MTPDNYGGIAITGTTPVQQGSKIAGVTKAGKPYLREAAGATLVPWRKLVGATAERRLHDRVLPTVERFAKGEPVQLTMHFVMPRLKADKDGPAAPMTVSPDLDKLVRAVNDAITHIVLTDDNQVISLYTTKRRAQPGQPAGLYLSWALCPELPPLPKGYPNGQ